MSTNKTPAAETLTYTAEITARGADTTVPDRADAVDAGIYLGDALVGECTLLRDHLGDLDTWGSSWDMWANGELRSHMLEQYGDDDAAIRECMREIVAAVNAADR